MQSKEIQPDLENKNTTSYIIELVVGLLIVVGLYLTTFYNYLLFHSLAEFISIAVAVGVFMIAWNTRRISSNHFLVFVGIALLFISLIDLIHTLSYKGMGVFPEFDSNLPTQLWIAARYLQAFSLLAAIILIGKRIKGEFLVVFYSLIVALLFLSIFYFQIFPNCFIEGSGLTAFKKISEYIISGILLIFMILLYAKRSFFEKMTLVWLFVAGVATIISELAFTFYVSVFGLSNLVGHLFKILAFYAIYVAIIQTSLIKPYSTLFQGLQKRQEDKKITNEQIEELAYEKAGEKEKSKTKDLERLNKLMVGREIKMLELKQEILILKGQKNINKDQ